MNVEDFFSRQAELEKQRQALIDQLVAQRKEIDSQLTKLGFSDSTYKPGRQPATKICGICKGSGHNQRSCPERKAEEETGKVMDKEGVRKMVKESEKVVAV